MVHLKSVVRSTLTAWPVLLNPLIPACSKPLTLILSDLVAVR